MKSPEVYARRKRWPWKWLGVSLLMFFAVMQSIFFLAWMMGLEPGFGGGWSGFIIWLMGLVVGWKAGNDFADYWLERKVTREDPGA